MKKILTAILAVALIAQSAAFGVYAVTAPLYMGDCNGDGNVTIDDATCVQKRIAGMTSFTKRQAYAADADGDGLITINDATMIQKHCAKMLKLPWVMNDKPSLRSFYADYDSGKAYPGAEVTFYAVLSGGIEPLSCEFFVNDELVQSRSENTELHYKFNEAGFYAVTVRVYNSFDEFTDYSIWNYSVNELDGDSGKLRIRALSTDRIGDKLDCFRPVTFTAEAEWGAEPYEFSFDLDDGAQTQGFSESKQFKTNDSLSFGEHTLKVTVRDADGNEAVELRTYTALM